MPERLAATLSMARKAGRLVWGFDAVKSRLQKDIKLVLFAGDLSEGSRRRMVRLAGESGVPCADAGLTLDEIWFYIGKRAGILALTDQGFANNALRLLDIMAQGGRHAAPRWSDQ